ncbi:hypothetical protein LNQ49_03955 [Flavobacterium sp. F-65]|uniref:Big-1 domain-containing protein n=1 Tax=Flavobacterium pisciphilum TaxID=2893755 RepID=A0ABS8MS62_9FLAO|nr:hypothetical protein [Flavobacterium sp. F-65]MCC9070755.1 hypothetical protein [Flavobacterium sp. F-65]
MKTKKIIGLILGIVIAFNSCSAEDQLDFTDVIKFEHLEQENLIADGVATLPITVKIKDGADPDKRTVIFTTDLGVFTNNATTITLVADANNTATAYLKSAAQGTATIKANVSTFNITKTIICTYSNTLTFTNAANENLIADNYSALNITGHINPATESDKRLIVFTTDLGTFTNNTNTISIAADSNGNASTYLKGNIVGGATVKIANQNQSVTKNVIFTSPDANTIFTFGIVNHNIPVDGVSFIKIPIQVNTNLPVGNRSVAFTTDFGSFTTGNATIPADPSGNLAAYLKSSVAGSAHIAATCNSITRYLTVNFVPAIPDFILLSANGTLENGSNHNLSILISAKRNIGIPTPGFGFVYSAIDSNGSSIGSFTNGSLSNQTGEAAVVYTAGNTSYTGNVTIIVALKDHPHISTSVNVLIN